MCCRALRIRALTPSLNESPSKKEGKCSVLVCLLVFNAASMKALPKRKGNSVKVPGGSEELKSLNESPSKKEGKSRRRGYCSG